MAAQTDVQQLIQSLVPSGVNNGNPGTVYNTPVPTVDAFGRWTSPTVNPAASLPALNLSNIPAPAGWTPPPGTGGGIQGPILPTMPTTPIGGGGVPPTLPPVIPPVVGPPVTPPTGQVPGVTPPLPGDPRAPHTVSQTPGGWAPPIYGPGVTGGVGGSSGGGSFDWRQMLDMLSEPLIPGDFYLSGTGEWDASNAVLGGLDSLLPGASWLAQQGGAFTDADWYHDQILDNARNQMGLNQKEMQKNTNESVRESIDRILAELNGTSTASGPSRPSSQAAGATTIAEGKAAQDMVADMQLKSFLNRTSGLARAAMNPRYQYER